MYKAAKSQKAFLGKLHAKKRPAAGSILWKGRFLHVIFLKGPALAL